MTLLKPFLYKVSVMGQRTSRGKSPSQASGISAVGRSSIGSSYNFSPDLLSSYNGYTIPNLPTYDPVYVPPPLEIGKSCHHDSCTQLTM